MTILIWGIYCNSLSYNVLVKIQYFVYPPFALSTAWTLLGILSINF